MRLITLSGGKHCRLDQVASGLSMNSDCVWIKPYTDKEYPPNTEEYQLDDYIHLNENQLSDKMIREVPLAETSINGHRYVFFENQLTSGYVVLIADDRVVSYLRNNWNGELITVRCHCKTEEYSERCLMSDDEYDIVFNVDTGTIEELEELVGDIYHYKEEDLL